MTARENDRYNTILHKISQYDTIRFPNTMLLNEWRHRASPSDHAMAVSTDKGSCDQTRSLCPHLVTRLTEHTRPHANRQLILVNTAV